MQFRFTLLYLFLVATPIAASAQQHLKALADKVLTADSVVMISHRTTAGPVYDEKTGKTVNAPPLIISGKLNNSIVLESKKIDQATKAKLATLLMKKRKSGPIEMAKCYIPHHSIVIYRKGVISFVEVCFGCMGLRTSKDIRLSESDFDEKKWDELKAFFARLGFKKYMKSPMEAD
jgi:hypothetical protein